LFRLKAVNHSMRHRTVISCNAANPVNYLACCGILDLLARVDAEALGCWQAKSPVAFLLDSKPSEGELTAWVIEILCSPSRWMFTCPPAGQAPVRLLVDVASPDQPLLPIMLDWWFETSALDGTIRDKSAWKMYAGQQTIEKIIGDMLTEATKLRSGLIGKNLGDLLEQSAEMTGRFGFDPRASRNALEVGYSANDLQLPVRTFVFAELLATFGLHSFFPSRTGQTGKVQSTRGWRGTDNGEGEKGFAYCLWTEPMPILLARLAATRPYSVCSRTLFSSRAMRKNYSNLTLARTINSQPQNED